MQILTIILLLAALGGVAYLIWKFHRKEEENSTTVRHLQERVETLSETVEKLRKLPVKGIEAGAWIEQLASVEAALKGPDDQIKKIREILKEQDETYRANFQVLADLSQEHFLHMNTHFKELSSRISPLEEKLGTSSGQILEVMKSSIPPLEDKIRNALEMTGKNAEAQSEAMINRIDEKFALEGEARAVMHMQTHDAVNELQAQTRQLHDTLLAQLQGDYQKLTSVLEGISTLQNSLKVDLSENQTAAIEKLAREWEENKKQSDEIFAKIEDNLQELIAEIAARHTAQMSLIADEFDMEQVRYLDLVARHPLARSREEEEVIFEQLVNLHKLTTERFTRHYYQHLIFMLPTMRKEAFAYFFARIRKNLPVEVEHCTFEQLTDRFQQIEETIMEYAVSDQEGLAEDVARQWKETVESVQDVWARKVSEIISDKALQPEAHLATLRHIPRQWLDEDTKKKLIKKIQSLSARQSDQKVDRDAQEDLLPDEPVRTQARKTVPVEDPA